MSTDNLKEMWEQQRQFMELLREKRNFPQFPVDISTKEGQKFVKDMGHECMHELFEALHLLRDSKTHRQTIVGGFDRDSFIEELSDALHYFYEICILSGVSMEELFEMYMKKGEKNFNRICTGY